jgi:cell wall-associated NlpC family hydrolase
MIELERVRAVIRSVRDAAAAEFGWTHVDLDVRSGEGGVVVVTGTVVALGLLDRVQRGCVGVAPLDLAGVDVLRSGAFLAVPPAGVAVFRRPHARDAGDLATELEPTDGPVECLARHDGVALLRAGDGTVGWAYEPLGEAVDPPAVAACPNPDFARVEQAWPQWIDAPYRLGGTRPGGVDCSGLVQRLLGRAGLRIPRHSSDQLAVGPLPGPSGSPGDIVAIWSADEAPCHVGLAVTGGRIVQASRSRARVVVETLAAFTSGAGRVAHVPWTAVIELQRRAHGQHDLLTVLRSAAH